MTRADASSYAVDGSSAARSQPLAASVMPERNGECSVCTASSCASTLKYSAGAEATGTLTVTDKPTLVILDGMNVLMSNGPTGGRLSDVKVMNTIVAGTDMVAVDAYGYSHLLERDIAELTYLHKANERGLGNINWKDALYKEVQA